MLRQWGFIFVPITLVFGAYIYFNSIFLIVIPPAVVFIIYQFIIHIKKSMETKVGNQVAKSQLDTELQKIQLLSEFADTVGEHMMTQATEKVKCVVDQVYIKQSITEKEMKSRIYVTRKRVEQKIQVATSREAELTQKERLSAENEADDRHRLQQIQIKRIKEDQEKLIRKSRENLEQTKQNLQQQLEMRQRQAVEVKARFHKN
jgi:hypothetical protein